MHFFVKKQVELDLLRTTKTQRGKIIILSFCCSNLEQLVGFQTTRARDSVRTAAETGGEAAGRKTRKEKLHSFLRLLQFWQKKKKSV